MAALLVVSMYFLCFGLGAREGKFFKKNLQYSARVCCRSKILTAYNKITYC